MLRPIAENRFEDRQIEEFQFAEKIVCGNSYLLKNLFADFLVLDFLVFWENACFFRELGVEKMTCICRRRI
jgi:hypothetical protein